MPDGPAFRAKGRGFTATLKYAEKRSPGGLAALREKLWPSDRAYITQIFIESGWYDAYVLERMMRTVAELQGDTLRDFAREQAVVTAKRDLRGIYRREFRSGSAEEMAARLPRGFNRYFEPMEASLVEVGPGSAAYVLRRVSADLRDLAEGVTEGFCTGAMAMAGVAPPLFSWDMSHTDEIVDTTPTRALPFRMLW
jgi:hypothetical protein